jgi:nitrous oxide reductase accessory protein NosL
MRGVLAAGGPEARLLLQRVLNGRRVACEPFREPRRRGYRFRATGSYAGMLFTDMCGPKGKHMLVNWPDLGDFALAGEVAA